MTSSIVPMIEVQLNYLIRAITTATDVVAEQMKKHATHDFGEVKTSLESLINAVVAKEPEEAIVERIGSISTGTWI